MLLPTDDICVRKIDSLHILVPPAGQTLHISDQNKGGLEIKLFYSAPSLKRQFEAFEADPGLDWSNRTTTGHRDLCMDAIILPCLYW